MKQDLTWVDIDTHLNSAHMNVRWLTEAARSPGFNLDSLSKCQLMSKFKLIELALSDCRFMENVLICGAWYGQLAIMMSEADLGEAYTGVDFDTSIAALAEHLNRSIPYEHVVEDMYKFNYEGYDTVINTSCEHIPDLRAWLDLIPEGTTVILQSNNYTELAEHINCSESIDDFTDKAQLAEMYVRDKLIMPMYERYTIIGKV